MTKPGPRGKIRTHPERAEIEKAIASSTPIAVISQKYGVSKSSLYRYTMGEIAPDFRGVLRLSEGASSASLLARVLGIATDIQNVRAQALEAGHHDAHTRAALAELKALDLLAGKLGLDDTDLISYLDAANQLGKVVGEFVRDDPELGQKIATRLRERGATELAEAMDAEIEKGAA